MRIVRVDADGNCMYRAVGQSYAAMTTGALVSKSAENVMANELRQMVAAHVRAHSSVVNGTPEFLLGSSSRNTVAREMADAIAGGRWGEELELTILQHLLRHPIKVYSSDGTTFLHDVYSMNGKNRRHKEPLRVAYHGGLHYDAIVPSSTRNETHGETHETNKTHGEAHGEARGLSDGEARALHSKLHRNVYLNSLRHLGANQAVLRMARNLSLQDLKGFHAGQRANMLHAQAKGDPSKMVLHDARNKHAFMMHHFQAQREYADATGAPPPSLTARQRSNLAAHARVIKNHT